MIAAVLRARSMRLDADSLSMVVGSRCAVVEVEMGERLAILGERQGDVSPSKAGFRRDAKIRGLYVSSVTMSHFMPSAVKMELLVT